MGRAENSANTLPEAPRGRAGVDDEDGQVLVEYALILILVSLAALALTPLGTTMAGLFANLASAL